MSIFQCVLGLVALGGGQTTPTITIQSLLREMGDRAAFASLPSTRYDQLQATSYDRTETDPNDGKTWFANADYGQFIRTEQHRGVTEWVVMEHEGPGAITRIWTPLLADKDKMLVRIYLDGSEVPTLEERFNDLMRGKGTIHAPFAFIAWPAPGENSGVGSDLYFPIPFAKSCKVTFSELPFYYSIDYRAYRSGTAVESFSRAAMDRAAIVADQVAAELEKPTVCIPNRAHEKHLRLQPGKSASIRLPNGPSSVEAVQLQFDGAVDLQALRSNVVEMTFDGERTVWCPIGEFFGAGVHDRPVWDRFRCVDGERRMCCRWTMPYRRTAEIRFLNLGATPIAFRVAASTRAWTWNERSMLFHTTWRGQYPLETRPMSDWNYLEAKGEGIYVGDTLTVFSPAAAWYGEGDERIYVDDAVMPSHLGTGTEDYYGYAWGMAEHFSSPFIAMPAKDLKGRDNWMGYTTTSRIRSLDAVPFAKNIKFDMEIWDWADCKVAYSAASFWYARPGATSNREPSPLEAAKPLPDWSLGIKGAIECEDMQILSKSGAVKVGTQSGALTVGTWSGNTQLFLQCSGVGDSIELRLPVPKGGRYHVLLYGTESYDYGIVRFSLDGHPGKDVDLWGAKPVASGAIDLGEFVLKKGDSVLRAEVVGTNPKSIGARCYFGLDCFVLKPSH